MQRRGRLVERRKTLGLQKVRKLEKSRKVVTFLILEGKRIEDPTHQKRTS